MKSKETILLGGLIFISVIFNSCDNQVTFDKAGWNTSSDPAFPPQYRKEMLKDLVANHKLVGLKYSQLIDSLGKPDIRESFSFGYRIEEDYGSDVDPVYSKDLMFCFSTDSVITSFKVVEWKK